MTRKLTDKLDSYMERSLNFAACRTPGSGFVRFLVQEKGSPIILRNIRELNGRKGFVIAPFDVSGSHPVVLLHQCAEELIPAGEDECGENASSRAANKDGSNVDPGYEERFETFMRPIREKRYTKLVLSRQATVERDRSFSPGKAFLSACRRHKRSYVYLFNTQATGSWMGCTPEILLSGEGNEWETVALAGTQRATAGTTGMVWDDKNLIEQMIVAHYIRSQLAAFGVRPEEDGPHTVIAGNVAHLKSSFRFALHDNRHLGDLLALLHPTPAVAGLPKEEAARFITANEGYDRKYYSGFTGMLDPGGRSDLYVNLRCMNIHTHKLALYAGGGLLPSSVSQEEWRETEDKMQTMLSLT
jgi:isochorismate synthase